MTDTSKSACRQQRLFFKPLTFGAVLSVMTIWAPLVTSTSAHDASVLKRQSSGFSGRHYEIGRVPWCAFLRLLFCTGEESR